MRARTLCSALSIAFGVSAHASFEMAIIFHSGPAGRIGSRYDAPRGRYSGSFGVEMGHIGGVDQDNVAGTVLGSVLQNGMLGYRRLNNSTDENLGGRAMSVSGFSYGGSISVGANSELLF